ncbi:RNA polymerase sigma factor [Gracilimonas halophila]|uniref:RNA polymerase sigma factor n=1 Tax=Gracilimonas halophila TaxID=1834464 RepID=A0ABW5JNY5_9BACT
MNRKSEHIDYEFLISSYQNGDEKALRLLIKKFHPMLVRTIYYYTNDQASVDDLAQEYWYAIIEKLAELKLKISFEAWALTIARRKAIDWIRAQQRARKQAEALKVEADSELQSSDEDNKDDLEKIRIGIQQLSPTQQIVLTMFYLENLSLSEISKVLGISKGTVKSRLFYAREELKNSINQKR